MFPLMVLKGDPGGNAFRIFHLGYCARLVYPNHLEEDIKSLVVGI